MPRIPQARHSALDRTKVIFIAGYSRSGSTLLGRLLGCGAGCFHIGEAHQLWKQGFQRNGSCQCGELFHQCPFWTAVMAEALGEARDGQVAALRELRRRVFRPWRRWVTIRRFMLTNRYWQATQEYGDLWERLVRAICRIGAASVVIDSSKSAAQGLALTHADGLEVHVVHLLRDSRAVAHSLRRNKMTRGPSGREMLMPKQGYVDTAQHWLRAHRAAEALRDRAASYQQLRYEDLTTDPAGRVAAVFENAGWAPGPMDFLREETVDLGDGHAVAGNPMRFKAGSHRIQLDDKWRQEMSPSAKAFMSLMTGRVLRRYGYDPRT